MQSYYVIFQSCAESDIFDIYLCQAEDVEHAKDQVLSEAPKGKIFFVGLHNFYNKVRIYSPNESACNSGYGFWSQAAQRWTTVDEAEIYSLGDLLNQVIPNCVGDDLVIIEVENNEHDANQQVVTITLYDYDDEGNIVNVDHHNLTLSALNDIINAASNLIVSRRLYAEGEHVNADFNELEEALSSYGIV